MKKNQKNVTTVEATDVQVSNVINNTVETEKDLLLIELAAKKETLKSLILQEKSEKKAIEIAEKKALTTLKNESILQLKETLFSLTQLIKTIKTLASEEDLFLSVYFEKNGLKLENLSPDFVAKNYQYKDETGVCLKKNYLTKFNETTQKTEKTEFFYYSKKQFWTVSDIVNSVRRFLSCTSEIKSTEFLYTYKLDKSGKRYEDLTNYSLDSKKVIN